MCPVCKCHSFRSVARIDGSGSDLHCLRCNARVERRALRPERSTEPPDEHAARRAPTLDDADDGDEASGERTTWRPPIPERRDSTTSTPAASGTFQSVQSERQPWKRHG